MSQQLSPLEHEYLAAATRADHTETLRLEQAIDTQQREREARLAAPQALHQAALWYATQNIAVFPCTPGGKRPATAHGFKDATTDTDQINAWWKEIPAANIGIPTGATFDVFDIDGPEGVLAIGPFLDTDGFPPILGLALTPRGRHYYVPATGRGNAANLFESVDYRGAGGYVVAPPSRTPAGTYWWSNPLNLTEVAA